MLLASKVQRRIAEKVEKDPVKPEECAWNE